MISADKSQGFMRNSWRFQQNYGIFTNRNNNWVQSIKIKFTRKHLNLFNAYGGTFQIGELVLLLLRLLSIHSSLSKGSLSHLSLYPLFFVTYLFLSHLSLYHLSLVPHLSQTSLSFSVSTYLSQHFSVNFIFWAMVINPWMFHIPNLAMTNTSPWDNSCPMLGWPWPCTMAPERLCGILCCLDALGFDPESRPLFGEFLRFLFTGSLFCCLGKHEGKCPLDGKPLGNLGLEASLWSSYE